MNDITEIVMKKFMELVCEDKFTDDTSKKSF